MTNVDKQPVVLALGGNAIIQKGDDGNVYTQWKRTEHSMTAIAELIEQGRRFIITHGNGPQVGQIMRMVEQSEGVVPETPLGVADAMTSGSMGYMIEQCLKNCLIRKNLNRDVVTLPVQVVVDSKDAAVANPTKPIGMFYSAEEAEVFRQEKNWVMKEDAGRGYRRYVASPYPIDIVERKALQTLVDENFIVVTGGGGGIPVYYTEDGLIEGMDCVIDKDLASMKIALAAGSRLLVIITGVAQVSLNFGQSDEQKISRMSLAEARTYLQQGQFPEGSMAPKIQAAMEFLQANPENRVIITDVENLAESLEGRAGTTMTPL